MKGVRYLSEISAARRVNWLRPFTYLIRTSIYIIVILMYIVYMTYMIYPLVQYEYVYLYIYRMNIYNIYVIYIHT